MGMVAPQQRMASAFVVFCGPYGAVGEHARQRGVCRQWVYREAAWVDARVKGTVWQTKIDQLQQDQAALRQRLAELEKRQAHAVILDEDKQAELSCVAQAIGVSLSEVHTLLQVLLPEHTPSVATLGRWTKEAGVKAGKLLAVADAYVQPLVKQAVADEIYVKRPALMVVEPESLCWVQGRLVERVDGITWASEFGKLPHLEQVTRDAGSALSKGVAECQRRRQEAGPAPVADQLDHFHTLREGSWAVGRSERAVKRAFAAVDKVEADKAQRQKHGQALTGCSQRLRSGWAICS